MHNLQGNLQIARPQRPLQVNQQVNQQQDQRFNPQADRQCVLRHNHPFDHPPILLINALPAN